MITDPSGDPLTRRELPRRIGRLEQVAGIEPFVFDDGPARGVSAFRFRTGSGLSFDILPDRGMDVGLAEHKGTPLAWLSPNGIVAPVFHEPDGEGWLNSFPGSFLVTCGLRNVGPPGERGGEEFGLHGRASHIPATMVSYDAFWDEEGAFSKPAARSGSPASSARTRSFAAASRPASAHHTSGSKTGSKTKAPTRNRSWSSTTSTSAGPCSARTHANRTRNTRGTPRAQRRRRKNGTRRLGPIRSPTPGFKERVFYHCPAAGTDGRTEARLENPDLGLAFSVRFSPEELPEFVRWTMTGEGTYVLGLEPATCRVEGPAAEEVAGRVIRLEPGETRLHRLDLEVSR
jgi:hypothetical protein